MPLLTDKHLLALGLFHSHKAMTEETSKLFGISVYTTRALCEEGLLHRFLLYSYDAYDLKEQGRIGFSGGLSKPPYDKLHYGAVVFKVTHKGHCLLAKKNKVGLTVASNVPL